MSRRRNTPSKQPGMQAVPFVDFEYVCTGRRSHRKFRFAIERYVEQMSINTGPPRWRSEIRLDIAAGDPHLTSLFRPDRHGRRRLQTSRDFVCGLCNVNVRPADPELFKARRHLAASGVYVLDLSYWNDILDEVAE